MTCKSNSDCVSMDGKTTCKQYLSGGDRTCQPSTSCDRKCQPNEYCNDMNICVPTTDVLLPTNECGTNRDCEQLHKDEKPVCKIVGDKMSCVAIHECYSYCIANEICTELGGCEQPGIFCIVKKLF